MYWLTEYSRVSNSKNAQHGDFGCALKPAELYTKLHWMFIKAQVIECLWQHAWLLAQYHWELQVHLFIKLPSLTPKLYLMKPFFFSFFLLKKTRSWMGMRTSILRSQVLVAKSVCYHAFNDHTFLVTNLITNTFASGNLVFSNEVRCHRKLFFY